MGVGRSVSVEAKGVVSALLLWLRPFPLVNAFPLVLVGGIVVLVVDFDVGDPGAVEELC